MSIAIKRGDSWVEVKLPIVTDTSLSQSGQAADAQKVGESFQEIYENLDRIGENLEVSENYLNEIKQIADNLPVKISNDGFTDVINTRMPYNVSVKEINGYLDGSSKVEIAMSLTGGKEIVATIGFDREDQPQYLLSKEYYCPINWETKALTPGDVGEEEVYFSDYLIENGSRLNNLTSSWSTSKQNEYGEDLEDDADVHVPSGENYLKFKGGDTYTGGSGKYNYLTTTTEDYVDLTEYYELIVEVVKQKHGLFDFAYRPEGSDKFTLVALSHVTTDTKKTCKVDLSEINGKNKIRFQFRSQGDNDYVRVKNAFLNGKKQYTNPSTIYIIGEVGKSLNFGDVYLTQSESENIDFQETNDTFRLYCTSASEDNPTIGLLRHKTQVDLTGYEQFEIRGSLSGQANLKIRLYDSYENEPKYEEQLYTQESEQSSEGTINIVKQIDLSSAIQAYGSNLYVEIQVEFLQNDTFIEFSEISFSKGEQENEQV